MWLARRFTIICLLGLLTGMAITNILQMSTTPAHSVMIDTSLPCIFDSQQRCAIPQRLN